MKRFSLALACLLLLYGVEEATSAPGLRPIHRGVRSIFDAGGFYSPYNVLDYGATGDGTTNDAPAINVMMDIVCLASGPRKVYFPAPSVGYRVGLDGANRVTSGIQVECGDIEIYGDGIKSIILPGSDNGNYGMFICSDITDISATCLATIENIYAHDLMFKDDDPFQHGHSKCFHMGRGTVSCTSPPCDQPTEIPTFRDFLTFGPSDPGVGNLEVHPDGSTFCVNVVAGSIADNDDLVAGGGDTWTATDVTAVVAATTEESHGLGVKNAAHVIIENVFLRSISDEGIDLVRVADATLRNIDARECSQVGASGACIHFGADSSGLVDGGVFTGGKASLGGGGSLIGLATESTTGVKSIYGVRIKGAHLIETDTTDGDMVEAGLQIAASQAEIRDIIVSDLQINMDNGFSKGIATSGQPASLVPEVVLNVANSIIHGDMEFARTHQITFTGGEMDTSTAAAYGYTAIDTITGGRWNAKNSTSAIIKVDDNQAQYSGAFFGATTGDCVFLNNVSRATTFTGNNCVCGGGNGDDCVSSASGTDFNAVTGNVFRNNLVGTGFNVGDGTITQGPGCRVTAGSGTHTVCGYNSVSN